LKSVAGFQRHPLSFSPLPSKPFVLNPTEILNVHLFLLLTRINREMIRLQLSKTSQHRTQS